jgi:hypothetical protein
MAPPVEVSERITLEIDVISKALADLPSILEDQEKGDLGENERIALSQEWGADMGTIEVVLDPAYRSSQMTSEQAERYRALLQKLREALPIIARLGFPKPRVSLEP